MSLESPLRYTRYATTQPPVMHFPSTPKAHPPRFASQTSTALLTTATVGALGLSAYALKQMKQFPAKLDRALEKQKSEIAKDKKSSILQQSLSWVGAITGISGTGISSLALIRQSQDRKALNELNELSSTVENITAKVDSFFHND